MPTRVTLTTDFGTRDPYVAELKGVLYAQGPSSLEVVDLTHEIGAQNLFEAALFVRAAWPRFPDGTIHLVVVDPGVGSARRALLLQRGGQFWVGPDNGVMSLLFDAHVRAYELEPARFSPGPISATFHGRDVFAPAAAQLASGKPLSALGREVSGELVRLPWPHSRRDGARLEGQVVHVDRFGNSISNLTRSELSALAGSDQLEGLRVRLAAGPELSIVRCYSDAPVGAAVALIGSSGLLEIAVANGHAAQQLGLGVGSLLSAQLGRGSLPGEPQPAG